MGYFGAPFYVILFLVNPMLTLTEPTFSGLPTSIVKSIDVYTKVTPDLENRLASKVSAFDTDLDSIIAGATKMVKGIGTALSDRGMDLNTAKSRIQDALKGSRSAITDISEMLERSIMSELTGTDEATGYVRGASAMVDSVKLVYDGVVRTFINGDYKNVSGVVGFLSDLTGNSLVKTFDLGAQAALVKGIIGEISDWGIPQLVDDALGATWNQRENRYDYEYDDQFRFSVTKRASDSLSPTTSLEVIERLMLHGGTKALIAENPSFPDQLLNGYVLPEGCVAGGPYPVMIPDPNNVEGPPIPDPSGVQIKSNYYDQGHRLIKILNELKPEWFYVNQNVFNGTEWKTDTVWNLQYLAGASEPAKQVLVTDPDLFTAIVVAPFYRVESGLMLLKQMYPYFVPGQE